MLSSIRGWGCWVKFSVCGGDNCNRQAGRQAVRSLHLPNAHESRFCSHEFYHCRLLHVPLVYHFLVKFTFYQFLYKMFTVSIISYVFIIYLP